MSNEGIYLMDADAFLDFMEALCEHYNNEVDDDGALQ